MKKLKIKDNINLKELENKGFSHLTLMRKYKYSTEDGAVICINEKDRIICISKMLDDNTYDLAIMFDLIKSNYVETIER